MARQIKKLSQILLKQQTTFGTAAGTLNGGDIAEVEDGASIGYDPKVTDISLVNGGFNQNLAVVGPKSCSLSMTYPIRSGGLTEVGFPGMHTYPLECAGFKLTATDTDSDSTNDRFVYAISSKMSEWKDATVYAYTGNKDTNSSIVTKIKNCMFNAKFNLDFDASIAKVTFDGKGILIEDESLSSQFAATPSTVPVPNLLGSTVNFFGDSNYNLISLEIDCGASVEQTVDKSAQGHGLSLIKDIKVKWTAKVYADSEVIPSVALNAATTGTISVMWGSVPNKHTITLTNAQIKSVKTADQNGISTYELSGGVVNNAFTYQIDMVLPS